MTAPYVKPHGARIDELGKRSFVRILGVPKSWGVEDTAAAQRQWDNGQMDRADLTGVEGNVATDRQEAKARRF